jgi:hypothetical protein
VSIGGWFPNTIRAKFPVTWVPVGRSASARTRYETNPSPSRAALFGGRNPVNGSDVSSSVTGSMEAYRIDSTRVVRFMLAVMSTNRPNRSRASTRAV